MYLICHATSQDHPIEGSCEFMVSSSYRCVYPDKFCEHRHSDSGDMFLICHMISHNHMFKGFCEFKGGSPSQQVATLPCLVAIGVSGDM